MASKFNKLADAKVSTMKDATLKFINGNSEQGETKETKKPEKTPKKEEIKTPVKRFKKGEYKTKMVSFRVSERIYNTMINNVENSNYRSIAEYMSDLIEKGL